MEQIPVLVTGVGGRSVGYQILACLKKFPKRYKIVATDADSFSAGLYEADKAYLLPSASDPSYIEKLAKVAKKEGAIVVLPGSHPEVATIANYEKELAADGIVAITNPYDLVKMVANKISQYILLQAYGFSVPKFLPLTGALPKQLPFDFPLIAKPSKDHQGSKNVYIVNNYQELEEIFSTTARTATEILLQEYVGTPEEEYTVGVVADKDGSAFDAIVMKRKLRGLSLLTERVINGKVHAISSGYSQGIFVDNKEIKDYCIKVAQKIGARGPLNIQLRLTENGVTIFEIHTRFSGSASQRAEVGFNEPDILIRNFVFSEKIAPVQYQTNVAVIRRFENVVVDNSKLEKLTKDGELDYETHSRNRGNGLCRPAFGQSPTKSRVQGHRTRKKGRPKKRASS